MILRSQLITLNQVIIGIGKTTNSLIVRVVCNVGLTVRARPMRGSLGVERANGALRTKKGGSGESGGRERSRIWG